MKKLLYFGFLFSLLLIAVPMVWGQDGEQIAAPRVIDTNPLPGEELGLNSTVRLTFDRPMDTETVQHTVVPALEGGGWAWDDEHTLVYTPPAGGFTRDTEYEFTVMARDTDGQNMNEPFTLRLRTVGYLEVVEVLPEPDSQDVQVESAITVIFNRPVVPLVSLSEQSDLPSPIRFSPDTPGQGEWLDTSIYVFQPDPVLVGGATYAVTVPGGLESVNGAVLAQNYNFEFTTDVPVVERIEPSAGETLVPLDTEVAIAFSQPMDPATQNGIYLEGPEGVRPDLQYQWSANRETVYIQPSLLLELSTLYDIVIDSSVVRSAGGALVEPLGEQWSFRTVPYPSIVRTDPPNGASNAEPYGGFRIYFSAPIKQETLTDKVTIDPEPAREYESYYYSYDNSYGLFFDTEPSTTYTITIAPGISDPYGNSIETQTTVTYTTAAYGPEVNLNTPEFIGLYNAYAPSTRLFITHRNIRALNLELYRLGSDVLAQMAGPNGYRFREEYVPSSGSLVRSWTVPVEAQLNQRRYELILLSETGPSGVENIECLGATPPRLAIGATAQVGLEDPRPSRVRAQPNLGGAVLTQYEPGTTFEIRGGPICADGYLWWQIFNPDTGLEGWMAEGSGEDYFLEPVSMPTVEEGEDLPPLSPGVYYLWVTSPQTRNFDDPYEKHVLVVATVNVTMKYNPDEALAWVTDMESGQPVAGVSVTLYDELQSPIATVTTDDDGLARFDIPELDSLYTSMYALVNTEQHFGYVFSEFTQGIDPWRFDFYADFTPEPYSVYMYTDRPIYRPDQPVYFRGVVRDRDDVTYTPIQGLDTVSISVFDVEGQAVYETELPLTPFGTFSGQFDLDAEAALGYYRVVARLPITDAEYQPEYSVGFNVAEYRAPEFQVTVTPAADAVAQGTAINIEVESRFFFGAPVSNAEITWEVFGENYFFDAYSGPEDWSFTDYNVDAGPSVYYGPGRERIANGEGITDETGRFIIEIPADLGDRTQSQRYIIEAVVTDESDQEVAGRTTVIVHQGRVYLGLAPTSYVNTAGQEATFQMLTVDWEGETVSGQAVDYRIVERRWFSVQEQDPGGRTVWTWDVEETEIINGSVMTDANGRAEVSFVPPNGGTYKIYGVTRDVEGNVVNSSAFMWVSGEDYVSWRQQNSNRIDLITDGDEYQIGDTAKILIASPFQGETTALVTVERGSIIQTEVFTLPNNSYVYQLPIEEDFAPNVFVSVMLVKGIDDNNPYTQFRYGMAQLNVETSRLALDLEVTPLIPEGVTLGPGDTVTVNIKATDWQGAPVQAEVGLSITDLAVLSIAPSNTQTLMQHFYGQQGIGVRTATTLTVSVDQVTQTIIDTVKGGGGGGAEAGVFDVRQEFVDTPLWEPDVVTSVDGEAQVEVTLPDNLTTWRIDARAVTSGANGPMLVGQETTDFLSTKPLLIRPLTPRFMVVGDEVAIGAIVNNNTETEQVVDVLMQGTGFELVNSDDVLTQQVTIPAGGRVRVDWMVRALDMQVVDVFFAARNTDGSLEDASKPPLGQGDEQLLPIYRYVAPETVGTSGVLQDPDGISFTEVISLPQRIDASQGSLDIQLDRSLAGPALDGLDYLENYPYQCLEQTISKFLPNVMTVRALRLLGQSDTELEANLTEQVNFAVQRLYAQQQVDGGWGWFPNDSSDALNTAYALIGLVEARNSGFSIDNAVVQRAIGFLNSYLLETDAGQSTAESWVHNRRAFVLYALARSGNANASRVTSLFDLRERLSLDAKAYLMMSMRLINPDDSRLATLMSDFNNAAVVSATGTHWDDRADSRNWTTNTRTTALILMAMVQHNADNALLPGAVRWLMVARTAGNHWNTTQETAWVVMALTDWMVTSGELEADYTFGVRLNGDLLEIEDDTANASNVKEDEELSVAVAELLMEEANRLTIIKSEGPGNLYYTAHITTYQDVPAIEPVSRGLIISRQYYLADDPNQRSIDSARVGEEVVVRLTIIAPRNLHYVVVDDPIPAGAEAIDPNLLTTSIEAEGPRFSRSDPLSRGWGWWWFSRTEFRDERVVMYASYLPRGTYTYKYTLRMGLEGTFNVIPTTGQEFYFPEVYGRTNGTLFTILPEEE